MFERLYDVRKFRLYTTKTGLDQYLALQQAIPRVVVIIFMVPVQERRPLIPSNGKLTGTKLLLDPGNELSSGDTGAWCLTYSLFDQSTPAGQRSTPVISWLNPRLIFTFRARGGMRGCPGGESQSIMADFKLFVSSERALDAPFCSCFERQRR